MAEQKEILADYGPKRTGKFDGYVIIIACFFIMVMVNGAQYCFGVFFKPMINEFGWTRAATSGAFSLHMFVNGLLAILAGRLADKFGTRLVVTFGGVILGTGYILTSQTHTLWQLYLFFGVIVAAGSSTMYVPIVAMITRWFPRNAGLMAGIGISGIGFGIGVVPIIAARLIVIFDWQIAILILGVVSLVLIVVLTQLLKPPVAVSAAFNGKNVRSGIKEDYSFREAILTRQFWMFFVGWICYGFFYSIGLVHIVPYAMDIGMSATAAATILTVIGLVGTAGRVGMGFSGDKYTNRVTFITCFSFLGLSFLGLTLFRSVAMLYVFGVIYGTMNGVGILLAPIIAEYFGFKDLGSIVGAVIFANNIGSAIGPTLAGALFDSTGSYQLAFLTSSIAGIAAAIVVWRMKKPVRRFI